MNWIEVRPAGDRSVSWGAVAVSKDGQTIAAAPLFGDSTLYLSKDGGSTWAVATGANIGQTPGATICMSDDGQVIFIGCVNGQGAVTQDGGSTWTQLTDIWASGYGCWCSDMSPDGSTIIVGCCPAGTFVLSMMRSDDYGMTWDELANPRSINSISFSADKQKILVTGLDDADPVSRGVFLSSDGGSTWVQQMASNFWFFSCVMSRDGETMLAGQRLASGIGGHLFISQDGGANWNEVYPIDQFTHSWNAVAAGDTGDVIFAAVDPSVQSEPHTLFMSPDANVTWLAEQEVQSIWCLTNRFTTRVLCGAYSGRLWMALLSVSWILNYSADAHGSITGTTPQHVADGGSGTPVTPVPASGYSFTYWTKNAVINGTQNPRTDTNVHEDRDIIAYFTLKACVKKVLQWVFRFQLTHKKI